MAYFPPSIGPAGLTVPVYTDILADNLEQFLAIYGANQYVGKDSAVYQFISAISLKINDCMSALQFAYNQSSPTTAIGAGLDRIVKMNGIARAPYSYSVALLTIVGTPGATIANGAAQDNNGNTWLLPASVVIPGGGSVIVPATSVIPGNITAEAGAITIIATPQLGWTSVNNVGPAAPGDPIETDSQLRARQAISVALPSQTRLEALIAAVAAVPGVTRYNVVENDTHLVDSNGNPPNSVTAVVEGGTALAVATAIFEQKSIGCDTNGTTSVPVIDPDSTLVVTINFDLPTYVPIYVSLSIQPLTGYTSAVPNLIATALQNYLNELQIGEEVTQSALYAVAMGVSPSLINPTFSIRSLTLGTAPAPVGTADIPMLFNQVAQVASTSNIAVTVL